MISRGSLDNLAVTTHTESVQLWHTSDCGAHTVLGRDQVCHGIRRSVPDFSYIAATLPPGPGAEAGVRLVAGSRCPGHECVRLGQVRNKKVKPLSLLEGAGGVVTAAVGAGPRGGVVTGADTGAVIVWSPGEEMVDCSDLKISSKKNKARDKPY